MSKLISKLNALGKAGAAQQSAAVEQPAVPGQTQAFGQQPTVRIAKPKLSFTNFKQSLIQRREWQEHETAALMAELNRERLSREHLLMRETETVMQSADYAQLQMDAKAHEKARKTLATQRTRGAARCISDATRLTNYGSQIVNNIKGAEMEEPLKKHLTAMVNRVTRNTVTDLESAALGIEFDPSLFGDEA